MKAESAGVSILLNIKLLTLSGQVKKLQVHSLSIKNMSGILSLLNPNEIEKIIN